MQNPQLSPDGQYWWDGTAWQPVSAAAPQQAYAPQQPAQPLQYQQYGGAVPVGQQMGRFARGRRIAKLCWAVLQSDRSLLMLPVLAFISFILMVLVFSFPLLMSNLVGKVNPVLAVILLLAMYVGSAFISSFFGAAMIAAATLRLSGQQATATDGMRIAWAHAGKLLVWSLISASVGVLIRSLEERMGIVGKIVGMVLGLAWAISTTFMIPVLIFEQSGVFGSFKRSALIIKQRWGESLAAGVSIGFSLFLWSLLGFAVSIVLFFVFPLLGIGAALLTIGAVSILGSALSGIYRAALFQYATAGTVPTHLGFTPDDMAAAFRQKRRLFKR